MVLHLPDCHDTWRKRRFIYAKLNPLSQTLKGFSGRNVCYIDSQHSLLCENKWYRHINTRYIHITHESSFHELWLNPAALCKLASSVSSPEAKQILGTRPADLQPTDELHVLLDSYFQDLNDRGLMLPLSSSYIPADQSQTTHNGTGICVTVLQGLQRFQTSIRVQ